VTVAALVVNVPSLAVTVFDPAVFKVTEKVFTPLVKVDDPGRIAEPSLEVIETLPA
jgi:hypothetical protein